VYAAEVLKALGELSAAGLVPEADIEPDRITANVTIRRRNAAGERDALAARIPVDR